MEPGIWKAAGAASLFSLFFTLLALTLSQPPALAESFSCTSLQVTLYPDGSTIVNATYKLAAPTGTETNVTVDLLAEPVYITAYTIEGQVLPVTFNGATAVVTLPVGVDEFRLEYLTLNLTRKTGMTWTLSYTAECESLLLPPAGFAPVSMEPKPEVRVVNGSVAFLFPRGSITVEYYITPPGGAGPGGPGGGGGGNSSPGGEATSSPSPPSSGSGDLLPIAVLATVALGAVGGYILLRHRRRPPLEKRVPVEAPGLDERDRAILDALKKAGRTGLTASELMSMTGIPRTPLYRRLNKLHRMGLIEFVDDPGGRKYRAREAPS